MGKPSIGQSHAVIQALANNVDWEALDSSVLQKIVDNPARAGKEFTAFLKNRGDSIGGESKTSKLNAIDLDAAPRIPYDGWNVESHTKGGQFHWNKDKVKLHLSPNQMDGKAIEGNKLRKELAGLPVMNANVLDYLLDHPHLIPEEWKGNAVFFWGTIYRNPDGRLYVRYLVWNDGRWEHDYGWLDRGWGSSRPALVSAS